MDRTLLGATTPSQSGPETYGNDGVLCIPQSSSITGISSLDCLVSYQDTRWGRVRLTPLQRSSRCSLLPKPTGHVEKFGSARLTCPKLYSVFPFSVYFFLFSSQKSKLYVFVNIFYSLGISSKLSHWEYVAFWWILCEWAKEFVNPE